MVTLLNQMVALEVTLIALVAIATLMLLARLAA
jgi:hypothetical protein